MPVDVVELRDYLNELIEKLGGEEAAQNVPVRGMYQENHPLVEQLEGCALHSDLRRREIEKAKKEEEWNEEEDGPYEPDKDPTSEKFPDVLYLILLDHPREPESPYGDRSAFDNPNMYL